MNKKVYIVAGTYSMAEYYARRHGIGKSELVYVYDPDYLRGLEGVEILIHDTAWRNPKYQEIREMIRIMRNVKTTMVGDSNVEQEGK